MLGYVAIEGRGAADRLLSAVAGTLRAEGWPLAGAVQINVETGTTRCEMDLALLSGPGVVRISQHLGPHSAACRLDSAGLEQAAGAADRALDATPPPRLLIVNKFGKQEADGRGFRPVIARALTLGVPVLTAAGGAQRAAFVAWAGDMAEALPPDADAVIGWCRRTCGG